MESVIGRDWIQGSKFEMRDPYEGLSREAAARLRAANRARSRGAYRRADLLEKSAALIEAKEGTS